MRGLPHGKNIAIWAITVSLLAIPATTLSLDISVCTNLNSANTVYNLTANVTSAGSCMNVTANNVTLDCNGFTINYSTSITGYGIYSNVCNNTVIENCNIVQGGISTFSYGIYLSDSGNGTYTNNNITTQCDDRCWGFRLSNSNSNNITSNKIITNGTDCDGIYFLTDSSYNNVRNNVVSLSGPNGWGITLATNCIYNNITNNTINNSGLAGHGLYEVYNTSTYNNFLSNTISVVHSGHGIFVSSNNTNISHNSITINGSSSYGIYLNSGVNSTILNNSIHTNGTSGYGIYIRFASSYNNITNNSISTNASASYGIYVSYNTGYNNITNNSISTNASTSHGIYIYSSPFNYVSSNNVTANGSNAYGIRVFNSSTNNTISNSILTSRNSYGLYLSSGEGIPANNTIYNNIINGSVRPVSISSAMVANESNATNYWNISNQTGLRKYSMGNRIGGNYYTNSTGNWFSDTCTDADVDGFCDQMYNVTTNTACTAGTCGNNTDFLAYSSNGSYAQSCTNALQGTAFNKPNRIYYLDRNISSSGTCITIGANNVTIDCLGYKINYSQYSAGYGIYGSGYNNTAINSCNIIQGSVQSNSNNIYLVSYVNATIQNSNLTNNGSSDRSIRFVDVIGSVINNNNISQYGASSAGIEIDYNAGIEYASGNNITNNFVNVFDNCENGIIIYTDNNTVSNNQVYMGNCYAFHTNGGINIIILNNTISTTGMWGGGFDINTDYTYVINNTISTLGQEAIGIANWGFSFGNLSGNVISTNGTTAHGIEIVGGYNIGGSIIFNNTVYVNGSNAYALYLLTMALSVDTSNNTISNSRFTSLQNYAVYVETNVANTPCNDSFSNNLFNGSNIPIKFSDDISGNALNFWNTSNQTGTRTYSNGYRIGGNYYTNSTGNGWSDTCPDTNTDGFCDQAYNVSTNSACSAGSTCGNNTDYLAYSKLWEAQSIPYILSTIAGGEFMIRKDGTKYNVTASGNINDGTWHHVVAVYDGSLIKIYVDGFLRAYASYSGGIPSSSSSLRIGSNYSSTSSGNFNGTMDNVRIYNRVLSENEVKARANGMCG